MNFTTSRVITGDSDVSARVAAVQNVNAWTKAGLMMRDGLGAGARHASLFQTPGTTKGVAFQRRATAGGASVNTAGPAAAPPGYLRLVRAGDVISAYYKTTSTSAWTLIGRQTFSSLPLTVRVGFATSSHVDGTLATATFANVSFAP